MTQRSAVNGFRSACWSAYGSNVMHPHSSPVPLAFVVPASFSCSDGKFSRFQQNDRLSAALLGGVRGRGGHRRCGRNTFRASAGCCLEQQIKHVPSLTLNYFKQSKFRHAIKKLMPKYNPFTFQ